MGTVTTPDFARGLALAMALVTACGGPDSTSRSAPAESPKAIASAPAPEPAQAPVDLSKLNSNIPAATPDTVAMRRLRVERIPDAPAALMEAAEREQGISRFCYQEYGQKRDPTLLGTVALVVTVEENAIVRARIGAEEWSSSAGRAVNRCLTEKVPEAWKLLPDAGVAPGLYVVRLQFRPS